MSIRTRLSAPRSRYTLTTAVGILALVTATACGNSNASSGDGTTSTTYNVSIETGEGNALPMIAFLADKLGYFKQNHINPTFKGGITTGAAAAAALASGSLNVIFVDPEAVAPLLTQGLNVELISAMQYNNWRMLVPKSEAGKTLPQLMSSIKAIGAPSTSGPVAQMFNLMEQAYKIKKGQINVIADASGAGVDSGAEQAIFVEPIQSCVLEDEGMSQAFSFAQNGADYPQPLSEVMGIPDSAYWSSGSWVKSNPQAVKGLQTAFLEAEKWANNPSNTGKWEQMIRASSQFNVPNLSDAQLTKCLSETVGTWEPYFGTQTATSWSHIVQTEGLEPGGLPNPSTWLAPGLLSQPPADWPTP